MGIASGKGSLGAIPSGSIEISLWREAARVIVCAGWALWTPGTALPLVTRRQRGYFYFYFLFLATSLVRIMHYSGALVPSRGPLRLVIAPRARRGRGPLGMVW